jgi:hypothetical protein
VGAHDTGWHLAAGIFGYTGTWLKEMVGFFGWLDTPSPLLTYLVWYAVVGLLVLITLSCTTPRFVAAFLLLIAIVLTAPVVISYDEAHRLGIIWQARYIMPMAVGVPVMAVALIERSGALQSVRRRLPTVLCVALGIAEFSAFAEALRRYTVGASGPVDYLHGAWQPPLGATAVTVGAFLLIGLMMAFTAYLVTTDPGRGDPTRPLLGRPDPPGATDWRTLEA